MAKKRTANRLRSGWLPRAFSVDGAVEYSGLPHGTIARLVRDNVLPHRRTEAFEADHFTRSRPGRRPGVVIIERADLDAYLDELPKMSGKFGGVVSMPQNIANK